MHVKASEVYTNYLFPQKCINRFSVRINLLGKDFSLWTNDELYKRNLGKTDDNTKRPSD